MEPKGTIIILNDFQEALGPEENKENEKMDLRDFQENKENEKMDLRDFEKRR